MSNNVGEIRLPQIDAILAYLPTFERKGFQFGQWRAQPGRFPHVSLSSEAEAFVRALSSQEIMVVFDWTRWRAEVSDPTALGQADLLALRKLLTFHVRADRFSEGHLISVFEKGHITAILRRLAEIRRQIAEAS